MAQAVVHGVIAVALIVAYAIVSVTGHDGDTLLGVLVGYLGGAGATVAVAKARGETP